MSKANRVRCVYIMCAYMSICVCMYKSVGGVYIHTLYTSSGLPSFQPPLVEYKGAGLACSSLPDLNISIRIRMCVM